MTTTATDSKKPLLERLRLWVVADRDAESSTLQSAIERNDQAHDVLNEELEKLADTLGKKRHA